MAGTDFGAKTEPRSIASVAYESEWIVLVRVSTGTRDAPADLRTRWTSSRVAPESKRSSTNRSLLHLTSPRTANAPLKLARLCASVRISFWGLVCLIFAPPANLDVKLAGQCFGKRVYGVEPALRRWWDGHDWSTSASSGCCFSSTRASRTSGARAFASDLYFS